MFSLRLICAKIMIFTIKMQINNDLLIKIYKINLELCQKLHQKQTQKEF